MSWVSLSMWREDIKGNGAVLSSPNMERMSWRMVSTLFWGSFGEACSRRRAGILFWPRYRVASADSGSVGQGSVMCEQTISCPLPYSPFLLGSESEG